MLNEAGLGFPPELSTPHTIAGKKSDGQCLGGHRGSATGLPAGAEKHTDIERALGVTSRMISSNTDEAILERELQNPQSVPVLEYNRNDAEKYWERVRMYAEMHAQDTAPRLFGAMDIEDLGHLRESQKLALGSTPDKALIRALDVPVFAYISDPERLKTIFSLSGRGDVQGLILRNTLLATHARQAWKEYQQQQTRPALHARPYMAVEGSPEELIQFMESRADPEINTDSLIFSSAPTLDQASAIRQHLLERMRMKGTARKLDNPFGQANAEDRVRVGIVNVQGGSREDAVTILRASRDMEYDVEVNLVENGEQLESSDPHCIVLPGGWHGIQFDLMQDLGINVQIARLLEKNRHFLLLCAGAILGRTEGGINDKEPNEGVRPGTALGLIDYRIVNNSLNSPQDVHIRIHPTTDPNGTQNAEPESRRLKQVTFSNGPYMRGCNPATTDVVSRISSDSRAFDINDDDGLIVGVQKRQEHDLSPVVIGVGYHHTFVPYVFLRDVGLYRQRLLHACQERELKRLYREQELQWKDE